MPLGIRILTQAAMQRARMRLTFCYLCGEPLPRPRQFPLVKREHVLPETLYPPDGARERWAIKLDVHAECEDHDKQISDNDLVLLHRVLGPNASERPVPDQIRRLRLKAKREILPDGSIAPTVSMDRSPQIWRWIRGFHAALYGEFLPRDLRFSTMPPVRCYDSRRSRGPEDADDLRQSIYSLLLGSIAVDAWDGFECWGGTVRYRSGWFENPQPRPDHERWACVWTLHFPAALEWSKTIMAPGHEFGWHGSYLVPAMPAGAAKIQDWRNPAPGSFGTPQP